jgi:coenzyme PQQ precursor peptide PqqA
MAWETPSFEEIDMSAEIGAYQSDFGDDPGSPDVTDAAPQDAA